MHCASSTEELFGVAAIIRGTSADAPMTAKCCQFRCLARLAEYA
jgi:Lon protease-like protein